MSSLGYLGSCISLDGGLQGDVKIEGGEALRTFGAMKRMWYVSASVAFQRFQHLKFPTKLSEIWYKDTPLMWLMAY